MNGLTTDSLPDDILPEVEELTGDLQTLAELVGVRMALKIAEAFGGALNLYRYRTWLIRGRDVQIRADYDAGGITVVELARKYGLSERHVYNILSQV